MNKITLSIADVIFVEILAKAITAFISENVNFGEINYRTLSYYFLGSGIPELKSRVTDYEVINSS